MYKIQVLMMRGNWKDCETLAVWDGAKHVTPVFDTLEAAQTKIEADSLLASWRRDGVVRVVPSDETKPYRIGYYWSRTAQIWIIQCLNVRGDQVGDAMYSANRNTLSSDLRAMQALHPGLITEKLTR